MSESKPRFEITELSVCTVCIHLLANGEYDDGTNAGDRTAAGMEAIWGDDAQYLTPDGTELGFRASACEGCGNSDHGDRFRAVLMVPGVTS